MSVDPLLNVAEHQSLNGYTYGNNSPVTLSDPAGLDPCGGLKCGHEGDDCSDAGIYCYSEKSDGTADTSGVVPSGGGGTASASSTGKTSSHGAPVRKEKKPIWGWLGDVVDTADNYVTAIVTQPEIWWGAAETAGSLFLIGAGGDLAIVGGALCIATLVGSAMVQQFLRGRSASRPSTSRPDRRRGSTRLKRPAIRPIRPSNATRSGQDPWEPDASTVRPGPPPRTG